MPTDTPNNPAPTRSVNSLVACYERHRRDQGLQTHPDAVVLPAADGGFFVYVDGYRVDFVSDAAIAAQIIDQEDTAA